jgi:histidinol-phosphate aminotransferase
VLSPDSLKNFCEEASKKTAVLIDEAYIDYANPPNNKSLIDLPAKNENVIVMRTFSKIHAMAGLRIGFIVGHPNLIQKLEKNLFSSTHFCVSNLTMAAAMASLQDEDHRRQSKEKNEAAKAYTVKSLAALGLDAIPSSTNFIFVPIPNYKGDFAQDMFGKNVLLRSGNSANEKWARISIGTLEEMQKFIPILKGTSLS